MEPFEDVTWQVLTVTLTLVGLVTTVLLWRARGAASGLRALAWSLVPLAAYLTGTLRLLWRLADAVVDWAVRLVLSPAVWLGIAIAGVAAVLFVLAGFLRRRGPDRRGRREGRGRRGSREPAPVLRDEGPASIRPGGDATDDLADIEAILKKHGIS